MRNPYKNINLSDLVRDHYGVDGYDPNAPLPPAPPGGKSLSIKSSDSGHSQTQKPELRFQKKADDDLEQVGKVAQPNLSRAVSMPQPQANHGNLTPVYVPKYPQGSNNSGGITTPHASEAGVISSSSPQSQNLYVKKTPSVNNQNDQLSVNAQSSNNGPQPLYAMTPPIFQGPPSFGNPNQSVRSIFSGSPVFPSPQQPIHYQNRPIYSTGFPVRPPQLSNSQYQQVQRGIEQQGVYYQAQQQPQMQNPKTPVSPWEIPMSGAEHVENKGFNSMLINFHQVPIDHGSDGASQ
ncbi:hypothetical protein FGO68_gene2691 [Halteria grandinella]|uniref:Uncharacterized protein n=1 Tax=Halteria grandinella TaxID=5974 RepID=A0A8J8P7N9_HALGN|nr:hypothetical protein FGO68_gene2691 [Halteria grandinella]